MKQNLREQDIIAEKIALDDLVLERAEIMVRVAEIDKILKTKKAKKEKE